MISETVLTSWSWMTWNFLEHVRSFWEQCCIPSNQKNKYAIGNFGWNVTCWIFCYTTNTPPKKTPVPPKGIGSPNVRGGRWPQWLFEQSTAPALNQGITQIMEYPTGNSHILNEGIFDDFPAFPFGGTCFFVSWRVTRNPTTVCLEDWSAGWMILGKPNLMLFSLKTTIVGLTYS